MDCTDLVVLVFLLMACGTTLVFAGETQEINKRCLIVSDCNGRGYFCGSNRTCQCTTGYVPNEKRTKCIGIIGSKCTFDSHCIEGAYCRGPDGLETCKCKEQESFYPSEDGTSCINSATPRLTKSIHASMLVILTFISLYFNI